MYRKEFEKINLNQKIRRILQYHERMKTTYSSISKQRHYKEHVLAKNGEYMPVDNSRLKGFYKLSVPERREL